MTALRKKITFGVCALTMVLATFASDVHADKRITTRKVQGTSDSLLNPEEAFGTQQMYKFLQQMQPDGKATHPDMYYAEGKRYYYGHGVPVDYSRTFDLWYTAAEANLIEAQHGLGLLYLKGRGIQQSTPNAISWFEKAAANKYGPAYYQLGSIYLKGDHGASPDPVKAYENFTEGAKLDDEGSLYALGIMYFTGNGTEQNYKAAFDAWHKCAEKNNKDAQYNIATMYENGQGVEKNLDLAKQWYGKAAENQHPGAITALQDMAASAAADSEAAKSAEAPAATETSSQ